METTKDQKTPRLQSEDQSRKLRTYEITAAGFDGGTDETDSSVFWVQAESADIVQQAIDGTGATFYHDAIDGDSDIDFRLPSDIEETRATLLDFKAKVVTIADADKDAAPNRDRLTPQQIRAALAQQGESFDESRLGHYFTIEDLAEKVRSQKNWSMGEVFSCSIDSRRFLLMKQVAPASCEMLTISQNGLHDVLTAYRYSQEELVNQLSSYSKDRLAEPEAGIDDEGKLSKSELIRKYEINLEKVKAAHPGWKGEEYVAYAELQLEAVQARGMEGLKDVWKGVQERNLSNEWKPHPDQRNKGMELLFIDGQQVSSIWTGDRFGKKRWFASDAGIDGFATKDEAKTFAENLEKRKVREEDTTHEKGWSFYWGNGQAGVCHEQAQYPGESEYQVVVRRGESAAAGILDEDFDGLADYNEYRRTIGFPPFTSVADFVALQIKLHYQSIEHGDFRLALSVAEEKADGVHSSVDIDAAANSLAIEYATKYLQSKHLVEGNSRKLVDSLHSAMSSADQAFQRELVRVYGANNAGDARYRLKHDDVAVQNAGKDYVAASDAWREAVCTARKLVDNDLTPTEWQELGRDELVCRIVAAGFAVSGPADHRAAENGEPIWVCNARDALAEVTNATRKLTNTVWNGAEVVIEGRHFGTVSEVDSQFVTQKTGREKVVVHEVARFAVPPKVGDMLDIQYKSGQAVVADSKCRDIER